MLEALIPVVIVGMFAIGVVLAILGLVAGLGQPLVTARSSRGPHRRATARSESTHVRSHGNFCILMLAADANQAWPIEQALEIAPGLSRFNLGWLEEPIRADRPWKEWLALRKGTGVPLAADENIASRDGFKLALGDDSLRVVQPDIANGVGSRSVAPLPALS
ncbi:enolase C-terminal domain-like protein [Bradyrhizobium sp. AUGA SZCCT0283]|uniref:enolase C-terminal domain-like protein n=1 Tax=Bradyrhizobium sp. AUGA SZCCT0283 TaxID=2807671 RepID=UPI0028A046D3|nr:enolase C-terminal domain-like protein [Bradyrhizobium sp. AUGA SZCCT0283]